MISHIGGGSGFVWRDGSRSRPANQCRCPGDLRRLRSTARRPSRAACQYRNRSTRVSWWHCRVARRYWRPAAPRPAAPLLTDVVNVVWSTVPAPAGRAAPPVNDEPFPE